MMLQPQLHHFFCLYFKLVTNIRKMAKQAFCNELLKVFTFLGWQKKNK